MAGWKGKLVLLGIAVVAVWQWIGYNQTYESALNRRGDT
jgi:hypothetical protein